MQRSAAVFLEGTVNVSVEDCTFKYLGGVGLMLSGFNRGSRIVNSTFAYIGGSAVASWGYTSSDDPQVPVGVGIDGTNGNQPHGAVLSRVVCREVGTIEKQASCYFQARRALSNVCACEAERGHTVERQPSTARATRSARRRRRRERCSSATPSSMAPAR